MTNSASEVHNCLNWTPVVSPWPATAQVWVQSQASSWGIRGKKIVSVTSLFGHTSAFSCQRYFTSNMCLFIRLSTKFYNLTASLNISLLTN